MSAATEFITFVAEQRTSLLATDAGPEPLAQLGLDDRALERWEHAPQRLVTLPHASPNVFFPRVRVGCYAAERLHGAPETHHLRVVLTHVNFSDLGWRPYAWWRLGSDGEVHVDRQFTRNKKRKHTVVCTRPPLGELPEAATDVDRRAAELAVRAGDLAGSYMLIGSVIEHAAGMHPRGAVSFVPLPWLVRFAQHRAQQRDALADWCRALLRTSPGRRIDDRGELADCAPEDADVLDNPGNLALLSLLGDCEILGGQKMQNYWHLIDERLSACRPTTRVGRPTPMLVPGMADPPPVLPSGELARRLDALGVPYSQGMAVTEHGTFARV